MSVDGDHLVGWANASLRFHHQLPAHLPPPPNSASKGVVLEDPLEASFVPYTEVHYVPYVLTCKYVMHKAVRIV